MQNDADHSSYHFVETVEQIDQLIYELYGLTDEETKTIEGIATLSDVQISKGGA